MRRVGTGPGRCVALAALGLLVVLGGACSTNILHGIDERAANDAARALERAGIGAEKVVENGGGTGGASARFTLRVARGDGVVSARVHLVLEEDDPLAPDAKPRATARAAVLLATRPGRTPLAREDVQRLVAGSVSGLDASAVAVVVTAAPATPDDDAAALAAVGPLRATPGSRSLLVGALATGLGVLALLAALLLVTARRLAALERAQSRP
jgi:type III secretion protein J